MLSQTIIISALLAATAQAVVPNAPRAPAPQVTPPPAMKNKGRDIEIPGITVNIDPDSILSDIKSEFNEVSSAVGDKVGDVSSFLASGVNCASAALAVLTTADLPALPTGDLASAISSAISSEKPSDACLATYMPSSLSSSYSSYESKWVSWYSAASPALQTMYDACPTLPTEVSAYISPCSTALKAAGVTPAAQGSSSNGNGGSSSQSDNPAPRETGMVAVAAAIAIGAAAIIL